MTKLTMLKSFFCCIALFFSLEARLQIITTVAGNGTAGYKGDGGLALNAGIGLSLDVDVDAANNIYMTDKTNNVVRMVNG